MSDLPPRPTAGLKPRDSWWTVLVIDPIAVGLLRVVGRSRHITPVGLTLGALGLAAAAATAFAAGQLVLGAILFQIHFLLDCMDGKLARATGRTSAWGGFLDLGGGTLMVSLAYAGLGWAMLRLEVAGADLTLLLLAAYGVSTWLHLYRRLALQEVERIVQEPLDRMASTWTWRRLRPYPGAIEVETLILFAFPILMPHSWFPVVAGAGAAFYAISALDSGRRVRDRLR